MGARCIVHALCVCACGAQRVVWLGCKFLLLMQLSWVVELGSTPVCGIRAALVVVHDSQPCLRAPLLRLCVGKIGS